MYTFASQNVDRAMLGSTSGSNMPIAAQPSGAESFLRPSAFAGHCAACL